MSTSGIPPYELEEDFSDDDDLLELETLEMMERDGKQKIPQRTCPLSGQEYTTFLLTSHPQNIKDMLRVDKHTFRALAVELVRRGLLEWDHKNLSVEESLAIFLYICGQNARDRVVADRFQHSLDTISRHFNIIRRAICNLAPFIIRPPNLHETPPEILHDGRYYPWFKCCTTGLILVVVAFGLYLAAVVYVNWCERNSRIFQQKRSEPDVSGSKVCNTDSIIVAWRNVRSTQENRVELHGWAFFEFLFNSATPQFSLMNCSILGER
ncbi:hypothetical protein RHMOL_Rhmol13G0245000 [Rhododendron molle]|uniref:Uncharacterized protein n=1 Tax=Rhododendron molle TaxID=49168 RepID=A0ACC0LA84_RHOML|nr:hypothetical protein RHMOL_Rhmol13G0245000 [Rhododendron molle]